MPNFFKAASRRKKEALGILPGNHTILLQLVGFLVTLRVSQALFVEYSPLEEGIQVIVSFKLTLGGEIYCVASLSSIRSGEFALGQAHLPSRIIAATRAKRGRLESYITLSPMEG